MTYATLMVQLQSGRPNTGPLKRASALAKRCNAAVIGIAAYQPMQIIYTDGYVPGELLQDDRAQIDKDMKSAEAEFRAAMGDQIKIEWRSVVSASSLAACIAREARSADLIITSAGSGDWSDAPRRSDNGDLLMLAGRPLLLVPESSDKWQVDRAIVAWRDTREARRAILDAIPLLKSATHVSVVEIAETDDMSSARTRLEDVIRWLERHGIAAEALVSLSTGDDASRLIDIAREHDSELIIAGAYGHSRFHEWALGGVTRELLRRADRCLFMSH